MPRIGYRWTIVALLFAATSINYIDRQVLGILAPSLQRELGWSETDYGAIVSWFSLAYGIGLLGMGRLLDRIGVRTGFSLAIVVWSAAAMAHALARTAGGFSVARAMLGLGEAGNFPGAVKAVAEWFPKRERAFATGIFNSGSNVGAILAPLIVPWIALTWGWRWAFLVTGAVGYLWLVLWLWVYRAPENHPRLSEAERAHIRSDPPEPTGTIPWSHLIRYRQTWAFIVGKAFTDPVWLFYLFWLPKFLDASWGVQLAGVAAGGADRDSHAGAHAHPPARRRRPACAADRAAPGGEDRGAAGRVRVRGRARRRPRPGLGTGRALGLG
ncbi:MAG: MFS transporter [Gemmatimonadetes bacterium]|nr:MFS transporter [Gemmatimonadota bacterium]